MGSSGPYPPEEEVPVLPVAVGYNHTPLAKVVDSIAVVAVVANTVVSPALAVAVVVVAVAGAVVVEEEVEQRNSRAKVQIVVGTMVGILMVQVEELHKAVESEEEYYNSLIFPVLDLDLDLPFAKPAAE